MNLRDFSMKLATEYARTIRPFLEEYAQDRLPQFDEEVRRLIRLRESSQRELPICVLGQSGVGKSTLLNALLDGKQNVLPQGGIGPLTAQATRVRFSEKPYFRASYLPASRVNQLLFALLKHHEANERRRGAAVDAGLGEIEGTLSEDELREAQASLPAEDVSPDPADAGPGEHQNRRIEGVVPSAVEFG